MRKGGPPAVISVSVAACTGDSVLLVKGKREAVGWIRGHISGSVITVPGKLVVHERSNKKARFSAKDGAPGTHGFVRIRMSNAERRATRRPASLRILEGERVGHPPQMRAAQSFRHRTVILNPGLETWASSLPTLYSEA
jgi:hypothetical protein